LLTEALEGHRALGDAYGMALCSANLAIIDLHRGDVVQAAANLSEGLRLSSSIGDTHSLVEMLPMAGAVLLARGDAVASAQLCGAAEALREAHGFELGTYERRLRDETVITARRTLGEGFEDIWAAGTELELPAALERALRALN
jgi:hypothetical protein